MKKTCMVEVNTQFAALHCWPGAPNFLQQPHRHQFEVTVWIETIPGDLDRTLEFFEVKGVIDKALYRILPAVEIPGKFPYTIYDMESSSTEALSDQLYIQIRNALKLTGQEVRIRMMEDGQTGSITTYKDEQ